MEKKSLLKSTLPFLPLLVIYVIVVLVFSSDELVGDEVRYVRYANNLIEGYYTKLSNPEFRNGPGYPLVIALATVFHAPLIAITMLNALFLIGAIIFFYNTIRIYLKPLPSICISYLLGLYPPLLKYMTGIISESFVLFLICGFLYFYINIYDKESKQNRYLVLSVLFLGTLALTKVIFGYVILCGILFYLVLFFFKRSTKAKHSILILLGSLMFCTPYLLYTYNATGKLFLWGTGGGEILYWRTTPFPNEYGDWISTDVVLGNTEHEHFEIASLSDNHRKFVESLEPYSYVQRDSIFKVEAFKNIKQYPAKYIKNTFASASRLFFNYPYSYTRQKITTYFYIVPNMFLLFFLLSSIYLAILNPAKIPFEIRFIGVLALTFMAGLTLLNGTVRNLTPCIPLLLFTIVFIHKKLITIKMIA